MKFLIITNDPAICTTAVNSGVDYIFVDLEQEGKQNRQGHTKSFISNHKLADLGLIRRHIREKKLLVRINPLGRNSAEEIERVIDLGADAIMLPMFKNLDELQLVVAQIAGRVEFWPLVETLSACRSISRASLVDLEGVSSFYFGLNDLHLELKLKFLFSSLKNEEVYSCMAHCRHLGFSFGFGGISTLDSGRLSGRHVLSLHKVLGSSSVILSRSFSTAVAQDKRFFGSELAKIRDFETELDLNIRDAEALGREAWVLIEQIEALDV